ncbi:MAG: hypothetical protein MUD14_03090 [Hydrococcus sp. Prado102]|nr:hypothetical protein [Hydrococcus sp. Prado102]
MSKEKRLQICYHDIYCTFFVRQMSKEKRLQIRLSEADYNKLEAYANQKDISMAQVLRDYINRLPKAQD